jgi:gamma-glutamylcyclotransferase (GGCT)/AIG2-like uncharacterized protein YtfP
MLEAPFVHSTYKSIKDDRLSRSRTRHSPESARTPKLMFAPDIPVFVYGSLMVPDVLCDALHIERDSELMPRYECATLGEYSRYKVVGAIFPAIVPCSGGSVTGRLIHLRMASQAAALDDMERVMYTRQEVAVQTTDSQRRRAYTYVWKGGEDELDFEPWDTGCYLKVAWLEI